MKPYITKVRKYIILQVLWDFLGVVSLAAAPLLQEWLFDHGLESSWNRIVLVVLLYLGLLLFYAFAQYLCILFAFKGGIGFETSLKRDFFARVFHMDSASFYKKALGDYISIQGNDITALEQDYLEPLIDVIRSVNMLLIYGVVLTLGVDWRLATVIIVSSVLAIAVPKIFGKVLTSSRSAYQKQLADYVSVITDLLEGFHIINRKTVDKITERHDSSLEETANKRYLYGKKKSLVLGLSELMTKAVKAVTFAAVAYLFYRKEITVGIGVATLSYMTAFIEPIDNLLYDITTIQSMKEVKENIVEAVSPLPVRSDLILKKKLDSGIVFRNVAYVREGFQLSNLNLQIEKGRKYAIVGKSGAGKSTLLKLLMGHETRTFGTIEIDGRDIGELELSELISYTAQSEHIYRTGLEENVTVFHSYTEQDVRRLAQSIPAKLVSGLADRDDENCQKWSGGEKQAVAFLRMLTENAEVVLLDEPFSAVDTRAREALEKFLLTSEAMAEKTVLMVTHQTQEEHLALFDHVIRVENGTAVCE